MAKKIFPGVNPGGCKVIPANKMNPNPDFKSPDEWVEGIGRRASANAKPEVFNYTEITTKDPNYRMHLDVMQIFEDIGAEIFVPNESLFGMHITARP